LAQSGSKVVDGTASTCIVESAVITYKYIVITALLSWGSGQLETASQAFSMPLMLVRRFPERSFLIFPELIDFSKRIISYQKPAQKFAEEPIVGLSYMLWMENNVFLLLCFSESVPCLYHLREK
jgi:hypothetical protein